MTEIDWLRRERDAYKKRCEQIGVCMTCVIQAPDTWGCSDCLNTGWQQGVPFGYVEEKKA